MPPISEEELAGLRTELEATKAENAKAKADLEAFKTPKPKDEDEDLASKARKERENNDKANLDSKKIERAITFNLTLSDFIKENKDILPSEIESIIKVSERETYDSVSEKSNALKVGLVTSFFSVQDNVNLLTQAQKIQLEDFNKLTKNGKEEQSSHVYENIFEPAILMRKSVKKAEELGKARSGFTTGTGVEEDYKMRLINQAKKGHLKEN